jgi:hypothetical protein
VSTLIKKLFHDRKKFEEKTLNIHYNTAFQSCVVRNFSFSNCLNLNAYELCCDCPILLKFCRMESGSLEQILMPSKVSLSKKKKDLLTVM